jgi:hypothetical protein
VCLWHVLFDSWAFHRCHEAPVLVNARRGRSARLASEKRAHTCSRRRRLAMPVQNIGGRRYAYKCNRHMHHMLYVIGGTTIVLHRETYDGTNMVYVCVDDANGQHDIPTPPKLWKDHKANINQVRVGCCLSPTLRTMLLVGALMLCCLNMCYFGWAPWGRSNTAKPHHPLHPQNWGVEGAPWVASPLPQNAAGVNRGVA